MRNIDLHNFSTKHMELLALLVSFFLTVVSSLFSWDSNPIMGLDKMSSDLLIILICITLIKITGLYPTAGFQKSGFWKGMLLGIPFLLLGIGSVIISNMDVNYSELSFISIHHVVLFSLNMLLVGMNEEIWMRAFVLNGLIRKYAGHKNGIWKSICISALVFGAIHIPNIYFMNPVTLIVQVINAISGGVLFGAIYIKSRNIWAGIIIHSVVDWLSLFIGNCFIGGSTVLNVDLTLQQAVFIVLLGSLPPLII